MLHEACWRSIRSGSVLTECADEEVRQPGPSTHLSYRGRLTSSQQQEAVKRRQTGAHGVDEPGEPLANLLGPGRYRAGHQVVMT